MTEPFNLFWKRKEEKKTINLEMLKVEEPLYRTFLW